MSRTGRLPVSVPDRLVMRVGGKRARLSRMVPVRDGGGHRSGETAHGSREIPGKD